MYRDCCFFPTQPLERFSRKLGNAAPKWSTFERLGKLICPSIILDTEITLQWSATDILRLVAAYGDALNMTILMGNHIVLEANELINQAKLEEFRKTVTGSQTLELRIEINKIILAERWFGALFNQCKFPNRLILYLYADRLDEFLCKTTLAKMNELLWREHSQERIVFLVPGENFFLHGPHLLVIGGNTLRTPPTCILEDHRISEERHLHVHEQCQDVLKWQTQMELPLTPWHLQLQYETGREITASALRTHFCNLFMMYTAERTVMQMDGHGIRQYHVSYSNAQQTVEVPLPIAHCKEYGSLPQKNFDDLLKLFEWAYDPQWNPADRLIILQVTVVDALRGSETHHRHRLLVENAPAILDNTNWHWRAFARNNVEEYWEQVKEMETYLGETVKTYSDDISEMASKLSETVLAAVGVLLGSFIAALFQGEFNITIFRIGLTTYAAYVLLFPLAYNMKGQWESYQITRQEFEIRKKNFKKRLPEGRAEEIAKESTVDDNAHRFERWFRYSIFIYVIMIVTALVAAIVIPGILK